MLQYNPHVFRVSTSRLFTFFVQDEFQNFSVVEHAFILNITGENYTPIICVEPKNQRIFWSRFAHILIFCHFGLVSVYTNQR